MSARREYCATFGEVVVAASDYDALAAVLAKYQACRVHDVDEKNWLRDRVNALEAVLRDVMPLLAECDCIYSDRDAPLCPCRTARATLETSDDAAAKAMRGYSPVRLVRFSARWW
jgi:hypothetical protein